MLSSDTRMTGIPTWPRLQDLSLPGKYEHQLFLMDINSLAVYLHNKPKVTYKVILATKKEKGRDT